MSRFTIEDQARAELHGDFQIREEAIAELRRRAAIPWDEEPNVAPCTSWRTCGRDHVIIEYDDAVRPSAQISRELVLSISASGVRWRTMEH